MIIGFLGNKGSGKDTASDYLVNNYNFKKYGFADPIKVICKNMFCFDEEQLYGNKKDVVDTCWNIKPREAFQIIGTEFAQHQLKNLLPHINVDYKHFWTKRFTMFYNQELKKDKNVKIVINDVRFQHEIDVLKQYNALIIKLNNNNTQSDNHISENEIKNITQIDHIVDNNSSKENLYKQIESIVTNLN